MGGLGEDDAEGRCALFNLFLSLSLSLHPTSHPSRNHFAFNANDGATTFPPDLNCIYLSSLYLRKLLLFYIYIFFAVLFFMNTHSPHTDQQLLRSMFGDCLFSFLFAAPFKLELSLFYLTPKIRENQDEITELDVFQLCLSSYTKRPNHFSHRLHHDGPPLSRSTHIITEPPRWW